MLLLSMGKSLDIKLLMCLNNILEEDALTKRLKEEEGRKESMEEEKVSIKEVDEDGEEDKEENYKGPEEARMKKVSLQLENEEKSSCQKENQTSNRDEERRSFTSYAAASSFFMLSKQFSLFLLGLFVVFSSSLFFSWKIPSCGDQMNHFLPMRGYCYGYFVFNKTTTWEKARDYCRVRDSWLVGWLVGWLAGWLVGWMAGWLVGWLVD